MTRSSSGNVGYEGETIACTFLKRKGFVILERNYRKPWGEIDIIAVKSGVVRFVEVKTVTLSSDGDEAVNDKISREKNSYRPEEQIHQAKLRKIARTAQVYMASGEDDREFQIDAVGVILDQKTRTAWCRLYEQVI